MGTAAKGAHVFPGTIFDLKRFAIHDGPGIRTTVFLKGCPLRCMWCHNPESISADSEPWLRAGRCRSCGSCAEACSRGAISIEDGRPVTDPARCVRCGECAGVCPTGAREIVGRRMPVEDVMREVVRDSVFYEESGGGVTLCGGEPLMQAEFSRRLLMECRRSGFHTALDTCAHAPWEAIERVDGHVSLYLVDLKHMDEYVHRRLTGVGNALILDNVRRLADGRRKVTIRMPLVPGLNDSESNIAATGEFVASLEGVEGIDILPYHEGGRLKRERLGQDGMPAGVAAPTAERVEEVRAALARFGVPVRIGGG